MHVQDPLQGAFRRGSPRVRLFWLVQSQNSCCRWNRLLMPSEVTWVRPKAVPRHLSFVIDRGAHFRIYCYNVVGAPSQSFCIAITA